MRALCYGLLGLPLVVLAACNETDLGSRDVVSQKRVVVRFDPAQGLIPMPNDLVRDEVQRRLDLPIEKDMTPAEVSFYSFLNTLDAWSTTFAASVSFTSPIDLETVSLDSLQLWHWGATPRRLHWEWEDDQPSGFEGPTMSVNDERTELVLSPPRAGWQSGSGYVVLVKGSVLNPDDPSRPADTVVRGSEGQAVCEDATFYYLKMQEPLDSYENNRAFPGDTREERMQVARDLEEARQKIKPYFDYLNSSALRATDRVTRSQVAALWSFSITTQPELAMDRASQRVPIPIDLLIDPDSGLVDLEGAAWDSRLETDAKKQANKLNGFGVSANPMFELTRAVAPHTATTQTIRLYKITEPIAEIPLAEIKVFSDKRDQVCHDWPADAGCKYISLVVEPGYLPLEQATQYAVVIHKGLLDNDGQPVQPMLIGHFLRSAEPLVIDGVNQLDSVPDDLAQRLEDNRAKLDPLLGLLGRENIIAAWPFTTLQPLPSVAQTVLLAETLQVPADPVDVISTPLTFFNRTDAFKRLFPGALAAPVRAFYAYRLDGVGTIVEGSIQTPFFLDRQTRRWRQDGEYELTHIPFLMTLPENLKQDQPVPVVIFAHAIVTDSRFLLTIAGPLAKRGFATVSIDFPYHGQRVVCIDASLVSIPNFLPPILQELTGFDEDLISLPPCLSGDEATCSPTGECLDANGNPEPFNNFLNLGDKPAVIDLRPASGAAFLDIEDIPHLDQHFVQALIDLGALRHSLRAGNWSQVLGVDLNTDEFYFAGQSLGAIVGSVYTAIAPDITRFVLNVPGGDLVDLFIESIFFGPQVADYFKRQQIEIGTYEHERFLNIARWLIDTVDPQSIAGLHRQKEIPGLIQIDTGGPQGDIIIPNRTSWVLQRVTGLPYREYPSSMHADLIVPVIGDVMLKDMVDFLAGEIDR